MTAAFGDIDYMQEMTPDVCKAAKVGDTGQLIDSRDNKAYWVAKLADLNCWMTQNLDYDDSSSAKHTGNTRPDTWAGSNSNQNVREYWDPGDKIISGTSLISATSSTDKHLLVGNYYSYAAATAGTAPSAAGTAPDSICPGQWKLPTSNNQSNGSFYYLLKQYGLESTPTNANGTNTINTHPLYFQYGGYVVSSAMSSRGEIGRYWSSVASNNERAYHLFFSSSSVDPFGNLYRYYGQSVRCLVQGS